MRPAVAAAVLALASVSGHAQEPVAAPAVEVSPANAGFRAEMPCEPDPAAPTGIRGQVLVECTADGFLARVSSLPLIVLEEPDPELDAEVLLSVAQERGGQLVSQEPIALGDLPGRIIRARAGGPVVTLSRMYLSEEQSRLFYITAAYNENDVPEAEINRFLESFSVVDAPPADVTANGVTARLASRMNRYLPLPIDRDTELLFTYGLEGIISYHYRLSNLELADLDTAKMLDSMKTAVVRGACSSGRVRTNLLERGVVMRHVYADRELRQIGIVDVTAADCAA